LSSAVTGVERSFACLSRYRRSNTTFERPEDRLIAFVAVAFISILARRLMRLVTERLTAVGLKSNTVAYPRA
jgi:hypothetical protein